MTDVAAAEAPAEPVPPAREIAAELEAAPSSAEAPAAASASPELAYPVGSTPQLVLDFFLDNEDSGGNHSMAEIEAALPNVLPGTVEVAVRRLHERGRLLRVDPGVYRLAPAKQAEPPKTALPQEQPQVRDDGHTAEEWLAALEAHFVDPISWSVEEFGPSPDQANHRIPPEIMVRMNDRLRKRQQRRQESEIAAANRAEADRQLRDRLIAATGGNIVRGPGIEDVAPIKLALEIVPLERILFAIRCKTDRKLYPKNEPVASWREERLLREIAESYCRDIVPNLIAAWSKAGKAPAPKAEESLPPPDDQMPDDTDELRRRHDSEHAPAGPHVVPQPDAAPSAPDRSPEAASASDAPAATPGSTGA
jgi:hypothetical protein